MQFPYLEGEIKERFDRWLEQNLERYQQTLTFTEIRKGVQALAELYSHQPPPEDLASRIIDGQGKRAALATYYAALHFLTAYHAREMVGIGEGAPVRRVIDLGSGSGAAGAAVAAGLAAPPRLLALDRSGWALDETRETWRAFGLSGQVQRVELPAHLPRCSPGDLLCLGWIVSALEPASRRTLLRKLTAMVKRGLGLLLLEPAAVSAEQWWPTLREQLAPYGIREELVRVSIRRPRFIQDMDKAARQDHQVIGARVLASGDMI